MTYTLFDTFIDYIIGVEAVPETFCLTNFKLFVGFCYYGKTLFFHY